MNMLTDVFTVLAGGAGIVMLLAMAALPLYADAVGRVEADAPLIPQPRRAPESFDAIAPHSVAA
ncbi:hypothetical protein [Pseudonocardia sp. N23]|uniref:hypothetical protein n=1 Tax=Pseudonocardia sp. N23 TaxID=1987376 RepID=UPI000BFDFAE1|nr:hypothetical protein [Pseudonocardia sp. N23]GAY10392.1 hypothetical protein TOK_4752 [Pseudonocardia sp. N23]